MMRFKSWPRWLRDTCSVLGAMSLVLIGYDLFVATHVVWWQVPLQIIVAFIAVGLWSRYSYQRQAAQQKKAQLAQQQAELAAQQRLAGQQQARATRERNRQRNQQHRQVQERTQHDD